MKKTSTKAHGIIDYIHATSLFVLPRFVPMEPVANRVLTGSAILTATNSLLTKYELGIFKVLPMKAHLGIDIAQSVVMAAAPLAFAQSSKRSTLPLLVGLSLVELAIVANCETRPKRRFLGFRF